MPGTHIALSTRTFSQRLEILGTAPEIRFTNPSQVDPAGRYRLQVSGDTLLFQRAATASWATATTLIQLGATVGIGASAQASVGLTIAGTIGGANAMAIEVASPTVTTSSGSAMVVLMGLAGTLVANTGGAVALAAAIRIATPTLTITTGSVTTSAVVYIQGQMGGAGSNYSLFVDQGMVRVDDQVLIGFTAEGSNVTGAVLLTSGGLAITDVANAWIDDASHGTGTVTHYIGNNTIDVTASSLQWKENVVSVDGAAKQHLEAFSGLLREYDYRNGSGHFVGLIAEDVRDVLPQYVVGMDTPSLKYNYMVGPLIWGWSDHEARISRLERQLVAAGIVPEQ